MRVNQAVKITVAARDNGMRGEFGRKMSEVGAAGKSEQNYERDFLRGAKSRLGVGFETYPVPNIVRDAAKVTRNQDIAVLLPFEIAHLLWFHNPGKFARLFPAARIVKYWQRALEDREEWFLQHPIYDLVAEAAASGGDLSMFLSISLFGDDGCLKKTRSMGTITWYPSVFTEALVLESRIPVYVVPRHILVPGFTECKLQEALSWAFEAWLTGRYPSCDHLGEAWRSSSWRGHHQGDLLCGGRIGVFTGATADQMWSAQHFRWSTVWGTNECCYKCYADKSLGALNFTTEGPFPERSNDAYLDGPGAAASPLSSIPGFHISTQ